MPRKRDYPGPVDERSIGSRLRELRNRRGMTQKDLARKLGMDQSVLSRYERAELRLPSSLLASIARILRASADEIIGLEEIKHDGIIKDRRFLRRLQKIDKLSKRDKQILLGTIDKFLRDVS